MNDLEFYKHCVTNPSSQDTAFKQAIAPDSQRHLTHKNCLDFDKELRKAMCIETPMDLEKALIKVSDNTLPTIHLRKFSAIAASLLFAVFLLSITLIPMAIHDVGEDMLDHVDTEIDKLHTYTSPVSNLHKKVATTLPALGITASKPITNLHYAGTCKIGNKKGFHLIMKGKKGLVTVLYTPTETPPKSLARGGMQGMLFPSLGGSMGIIGNMGEDLESIRQELEKKLTIKPHA